MADIKRKSPTLSPAEVAREFTIAYINQTFGKANRVAIGKKKLKQMIKASLPGLRASWPVRADATQEKVTGHSRWQVGRTG